jgi:Tfp pilus assembly protein PilZ
MVAITNVRQFPRAAIKTSTFLLGADGAVKVKAKNISPVGVFVSVDRILPVGERVYINVDLPNYHGSVLSQAEVVWICVEKSHRRMGMGLKFLNLSNHDFFRVHNFVRHYEES